MHGEDKGLVEYQGKPLIEYVLNSLPAGLEHIVISANRNLERYRHYAEVLEDDEFVLQGPLSGVLEAMKHSHTDYLLCLPCDTPFLPHNLVSRLLETMHTEAVDVAIAATVSRPHYVISLMKCSLEDALRQFLTSGERRVGLWLQQQSHYKVMFEGDERPFMNINHRQELED